MANVGNVYYRSGCTARANDIRSYPQTNIVANAPKARKIQNKIQRIIIVNDVNITNRNLSMVLAYYLSRFYMLEGHHDIDRTRLAASIAGIIGNCIEWGVVAPWGRVTRAYADAGIELEIQAVPMHVFLQTVENDERLHEFLSQWEGDIAYIFEHTDMMLILSAVFVLSMFKNLNNSNYTPWMNRRVITFSGTVGDVYTPENVRDTTFPPLSQMQTLHQTINANHELRRTLFLELVTLAKSSGTSPIALAFSEVHHLIRGHEMQHLVLIDRYIMCEYPEFLRTAVLRDLQNRFAAAQAYLKDVPPEDRMYVKILRNKDETALLNRQIFKDAATIATTIARFKDSTFNNYFYNTDEAHIRFVSIVERYLSQRASILSVELGDNDSTNMGINTKKVYFEKVLLEMDNVEKTHIQEQETEGGILNL